ncbi:MAG: BREX-2 system adenine-specific DNA-methyltransferase PglX, partial [Frankia sp.]|nr:BREX-2 system adenine-specific DNA-methyltransferase PglX [Frankia sp.]
MIDSGALLADAQRLLDALETDLRRQVDTLPAVHGRLRAEYLRAYAADRTCASWLDWLDGRVGQAAAAWFLGTVFVRFCEDNGLLTESFLAGPTPERRALAEKRTEEFHREYPYETARGWLLTAFDEIAQVPASAPLFARRHSPLYQIPVSHDAASRLIAFWRRSGPDGGPVHDFTHPDWDTSFLADLHENLAGHTRASHRPARTPVFVADLLLDLTLTPALAGLTAEPAGPAPPATASPAEPAGLAGLRLIDPACGAGQVLLAAFDRLLAAWRASADGPASERERVRLALASLHGVDVDPAAVAVTRFRLLVAALRAAGVPTLAAAVRDRFGLRIAVGDALRERPLAGPGRQPTAYDTEDLHELPDVLAPGSYHVVVGHPPAGPVADARDAAHYRERFAACTGPTPAAGDDQLDVAVPFVGLFTTLARRGGPDGGHGAGYFGLLTAAAAVTARPGAARVTRHLTRQVELTHVIDTSAAAIPGQERPGVLLAGRNASPDPGGSVRVVLATQPEP